MVSVGHTDKIPSEGCPEALMTNVYLGFNFLLFRVWNMGGPSDQEYFPTFLPWDFRVDWPSRPSRGSDKIIDEGIDNFMVSNGRSMWYEFTSLRLQVLFPDSKDVSTVRPQETYQRLSGWLLFRWRAERF